jgi:predicted alpha/beta superfamily hydrolase
MKNKGFLLVVSFLLSGIVFSQTTVRFQIESLPSYHNQRSDIFIAGSFNEWNPKNNNYKFQRTEKGEYFLEISMTNGDHEYKITRGSWNEVESKKGGKGMANRKISVKEKTEIKLNIEEWADHFPPEPVKSTASANVKIIDTAFHIPQLNRTRRIWIYLPESYGKNKEERFPVLYMHDGQNLFDNLTSFSGEWGVDEFLDSTTLAKCIVVGIDHGGEKRLKEYNPYNHKKYGKGEGRRYVKFLVETLKPYIDNKFQTHPDKNNTFIAGSSMGGLISMFAVLEYPKIFGAAGVFSPAFWVAGKKIFEDIRKKGKKVDSKIYLYAGKKEGERMVPDMLKAFEILTKVSPAKIHTVIRDEGTHSEEQWRKEFPLFYQIIK